MGVRDWFRRTRVEETITEIAPAKAPDRAGFEYGIPSGGLTEYNAGIGASTGTDRRSLMQQLYEAYLACPWSWACVNAISRTITAGGLVMDWDADDSEGDQDPPPKPTEVLALERLFRYVNPREDIRQLMRSVIADLLVFGDAFIEVVWIGNQPVALYSLDSPTTQPIADEHGQVTGYVQITEFGQRADFAVRDVIHISLDSPRSGIFGVSPTQAALLPITTWLFAAATLKETFRKGNPPDVHVDMPQSMSTPEISKWTAQYMTRNIGPRNIGNPKVTKGGGTIKELHQARLAEYLDTLAQKRDEILATYGVPPAEATVIESGNLGGGTGESQRKTFLVNTCQPIAELVLEKINFHLALQGFGITGWHVKFGEVDMRDSKTIEEIRDIRIRSGLYTLNRGRVEIGEPPVEGGNDPILIDRQHLVLWRDIGTKSAAGIAKDLRGSALEPDTPGGDAPLGLVKASAAGPPKDPVGDVPTGLATAESRRRQRPGETWRDTYQRRLAEALEGLPHADAA